MLFIFISPILTLLFLILVVVDFFTNLLGSPIYTMKLNDFRNVVEIKLNSKPVVVIGKEIGFEEFSKQKNLIREHLFNNFREHVIDDRISSVVPNDYKPFEKIEFKNNDGVVLEDQITPLFDYEVTFDRVNYKIKGGTGQMIIDDILDTIEHRLVTLELIKGLLIKESSYFQLFVILVLSQVFVNRFLVDI